jgi:hypothetical protein
MIYFKEIKQLFDTNDNHFWNLYLENLDTSILEIIYKIVFFNLDTKNWTLFDEIKIKLENFINSLKFLTILKNAAIESHHWMELMKIYKTFKDTDIIDLNDETK